jgi:hypothetical protein
LKYKIHLSDLPKFSSDLTESKCVSIMRTNRLVQFREIIAVYYEECKEVSTLRGKDADCELKRKTRVVAAVNKSYSDFVTPVDSLRASILVFPLPFLTLCLIS